MKVRTGISQEAKAAHLSSSENKEEIKFSSAEKRVPGVSGFPLSFSPPLPVTEMTTGHCRE